MALALVAAGAFALMPEGDLARMALTAPVLLLVPGYLLLQAVLVPARPISRRLVHALFGVGLSVAVVGLAALSTAVVDGGFRPVPIVAVVTVVSLAFALVAFRRRRSSRRGAHPTPDI